jgi:hypothetical protein
MATAERKPDPSAVMLRQTEDYALFSRRLEECDGDEEKELLFLNELQTAARSLATNGVNFVLTAQHLEAEAAYRQEIAEKYRKSAAYLKRWADAAKDAVRRAMEETGMTKLPGDGCTVSIQNNPPKMVIEDEDQIPKDYWVKEPVLQKDILKADLLAGADVPGAKIERGTHLRVRF